MPTRSQRAEQAYQLAMQEAQAQEEQALEQELEEELEMQAMQQAMQEAEEEEERGRQCSYRSRHENHPAYMCNPNTGRWIRRDGPTARALLQREVKPASPMTTSDSYLANILQLRTPRLKKFQKYDFTVNVVTEAGSGEYQIIVSQKDSSDTTPIMVARSANLQTIEKQIEETLEAIVREDKDKVRLGTVFKKLKGTDRSLTITEEEATELRQIRDDAGVELLSCPKRHQRDCPHNHNFIIEQSGWEAKRIHCLRPPPHLGNELLYELLLVQNNLTL